MSIVIYADDLCLYRVIKNGHDMVSFQNDIDVLVSEINDLNLGQGLTSGGYQRGSTYSLIEYPGITIITHHMLIEEC